MGANPVRGEVPLALGPMSLVLRPTFSALVAAESEMGSLLALLERAGSGDVRLSDMGPLFWHSLAGAGPELDRGTFEAALLEAGLARLLTPYRQLLAAVFGGRP
jgi:hypothetical protein